MSTLIFKICTIEDWAIADMMGVFAGSEADLADGFIHFSSDETIETTAAKYFAGQDDLLLIAVEPEKLGNLLRWEPARDGSLFPHLYGTLDPGITTWVIPMPIGESGVHVLPELDE
jgi:uncharacterized protein (DUF952 family)